MWAYAAAVSASAMAGLTDRALRLADDGVRLAREHGGAPLPGLPCLLMAQGSALLFAGQLSAARHAAERGYQHAIGIDGAGLIAQWAALRGMIAQVRGDLPVAVASLREAVALAGQQGPPKLRRVHLTVLAGVLAMVGDPAAEVWLRRADAVNAEVPTLYASQVEINRAWVVAATGDSGRAAGIAIDTASHARKVGLTTVEAFALHHAARHGAARRVQVRLAEIAAQADSHLVAAYATSAAALADGHGQRLSSVAATFRDLDAPLLAAEFMAAAQGCFYAAGERERAARARELAVAFAERCGASCTRRLAGGRITVLTPRERHIAMLAAQKMSSAEIAHRLQVSVRTVDNHLGRAYAKLGVTGRSGLTAFLRGDARPQWTQDPQWQ
jgi:DNA-binding CsgD family transcriptional regulator